MSNKSYPAQIVTQRSWQRQQPFPRRLLGYRELLPRDQAEMWGRGAFIGEWHLGGGEPEWQPEVDGGFQSKRFMLNRGHWKKFVLAGGSPAVGATKDGNPNYNVAGADEETDSTDWLTNRAIDWATMTKCLKGSQRRWKLAANVDSNRL